MGLRNSKSIDASQRLYSILGLLSLRLEGSLLWHVKDFDQETTQGAIFTAYSPTSVEGQESLAYILAVDVTADETESDISMLEESDVSAIDRSLHDDTLKQFKTDGRQMVRWMSSQLNRSTRLNGLMTVYIAEELRKEAPGHRIARKR